MESGKWKNTKRKKSLGFVLSTIYFPLSTFLFIGCAAPAANSPSYPLPSIHTFSLPQTAPASPSGIYHTVQKGETLWRIGRTYNVPIEDLVKTNRLPDSTKVKAGQKIFIPRLQAPVIIETAGTVEFIWPAKGKIISYFRDHKQGETVNQGIDIELAPGTPVAASKAGKISFTSEKVKGLGKSIIMDHRDGYQTVYGHLSEIRVQPGDEVKQGSIIAKSGNTGRTLGASLHFEIRENHKSKNPLHYLP